MFWALLFFCLIWYHNFLIFTHFGSQWGRRSSKHRFFIQICTQIFQISFEGKISLAYWILPIFFSGGGGVGLWVKYGKIWWIYILEPKWWVNRISTCVLRNNWKALVNSHALNVTSLSHVYNPIKWSQASIIACQNTFILRAYPAGYKSILPSFAPIRLDNISPSFQFLKI